MINQVVLCGNTGENDAINCWDPLKRTTLQRRLRSNVNAAKAEKSGAMAYGENPKCCENGQSAGKFSCFCIKRKERRFYVAEEYEGGK